MSVRTLLIVEDDDELREALLDTLELDGYQVLAAASAHEAFELVTDNDIAMIISDVQMKPMDGIELLKKVKTQHPELPVILMTAYGTIQKAVEAMRLGACHYLVKPFAAPKLIETVKRFLPNELPFDGLVAKDEKSTEILELARRVAASEATVMLSGESGTGKEVFARFIHNQSPRADGPFVAINCAAIPENMLEAVLFGHEKGAFTGATSSRAGKFEQAQGGTILLDEISEMDLALQAKLLRVLQERELERLGGQRTITLDTRVLATTNRDLIGQVDDGKFREDLYYRLNVFPLVLPPLRERPGDIVPLVEHLLARNLPHGKPIELTEAAAQRLTQHDWPGNVRELDNLMQRSLILLTGDVLDAADLRFEQASRTRASVTRIDQGETAVGPGDQGKGYGNGQESDQGEAQGNVLRSGLRDKEERLILEALSAGNGNRKAAAERLGISPRTLRYKIARLKDNGIAVPDRFGANFA